MLNAFLCFTPFFKIALQEHENMLLHPTIL